MNFNRRYISFSSNDNKFHIFKNELIIIVLINS
jgi:hypothetical protein